MKEEWMEHYECLEQIRQEGSVNMFGAAGPLSARSGIDYDFAVEVLKSWMANYNEIIKLIGR